MAILIWMRILYKTSFLIESQAFLNSIKTWCTASLYSYFYSSIWWMQNTWSVVDLLSWNRHWWSPIISSAFGINLDNKILDNIFYVAGKSDASIITTVCFIVLLIDTYNDWLLPFLRQFLLIRNTNNKFMDLKAILKFTLKQLRHVSVQSHHPQGAHYSCLQFTSDQCHTHTHTHTIKDLLIYAASSPPN